MEITQPHILSVCLGLCLRWTISFTGSTSPLVPGPLPSFLLRIIDAIGIRTTVQSESKLVHSALSPFFLESDTFQNMDMSIWLFFGSTTDSARLPFVKVSSAGTFFTERINMDSCDCPSGQFARLFICSLLLFSFLLYFHFYGNSPPKAPSVFLLHLEVPFFRRELFVLGFC